MHLARIWILAAVVAVSGMALARVGRGATPGGGQAPVISGATLVSRDPVAASELLGTVYKREVEGFRIMPPAGSRVIERSGVDLMSFVVDAKSWGGSVQRITVTKVMSLEDFVKVTKGEVTGGTTFKGGQVLEERYMRKGPYPAAKLSFSMQADLGPGVPSGVLEQMAKQMGQSAPRPTQDVRVSLLRQELVAQVKDNQFITLIMYSPLSDRDLATRTFDMMLNEFELYDAAALKQHRVEAIAAGKDWLAKQSAENYAAKLINEPLFYRILVGGKDVGYLRFDEGAKEADPKGGTMIGVERDKHKGVIFHVNFRSFPDDGSVVYGQNEAFWGFSKTATGERIFDYSCWTNVSKTRTVVPVPVSMQRPGQPTMQVVTPWMQETGVLLQIDQPHQILVTLSGDATQRLPEGVNQIIPPEAAAPLPKILEYTWPRFVDLTKPAEMTFVVFDSVSKKLANRNLIVTGEKESITIDGKAVTCFKCRDELDPNSTTIWTDGTGRIQMMRTSDQSVMVPTTETAMVAKWSKRLSDQ